MKEQKSIYSQLYSILALEVSSLGVSAANIIFKPHEHHPTVRSFSWLTKLSRKEFQLTHFNIHGDVWGHPYSASGKYSEKLTFFTS